MINKEINYQSPFQVGDLLEGVLLSCLSVLRVDVEIQLLLAHEYQVTPLAHVLLPCKQHNYTGCSQITVYRKSDCWRHTFNVGLDMDNHIIHILEDLFAEGTCQVLGGVHGRVEYQIILQQNKHIITSFRVIW